MNEESSSIADQAGVTKIIPAETVDETSEKLLDAQVIHKTVKDEDVKPPEYDDEGLRLEYDVAICGTGLVQSILASALARAGKSVIHCDGADYYGELDAVWTLSMVDDFLKSSTTSDSNDNKNRETSTELIALSLEGGQSSLQWHPSHCSAVSSPFMRSGIFSFGITVGTRVQTPHGNGTVKSIRRASAGGNSCVNEAKDPQQSNNDTNDLVSVEIELDQWKLANGQSPIVYVNVPIPITEKNDDVEAIEDPQQLEDILRTTRSIRSIPSVEAERILREASRRFALDATPTFILASGRAVQGMLQSGVAEYLEFKTVEGLYWLEDSKQHRNGAASKTSRSKRNQESADNEGISLSRVPCSKNDIFGTKLLAPMEKRRFMKFIQLAMDYATKMSVAEELEQRNNGEDDNSNEESPSDIPSSSELESNEEVQSLNERHLNQGRSLARPQNKAVNASELQILHEAIEEGSLTFDDFLANNHKLSPRLRSIVRFALAWETDAASTSLKNGMTALRQHLQALGRYGTTAFLVPLYGSGELSQAFCRSAAVFGATYLLRRTISAIQIENKEDDSCCSDKRVTGIVLSSDAFADTTSEMNDVQSVGSKTIRCSQVVAPLSALNAKINQAPDPGLQRRIVRRISLLKGTVVPSKNGEQRHLIFVPPNTVGNTHAIHAVLLDGSAFVAPNGCAVLHLTTTITCAEKVDDSEQIEMVVAMLQRAQTIILDSNQSLASSETDATPIEIYYASFSHSIAETKDTSNSPNGLHICSHTGQALTADVAFEQAEAIFQKICPGAEFLGLSTSIDKVIRERAEEKYYDDEEKHVLESAIDMIEEKSSKTDTL